MNTLKRITVLTVLLSLPVLLGACTKSAMCDSPKVKAEVIKSMEAGFKRRFTQMGNAEALKRLKIGLENIVQVDLNEKTHQYSCTADMTVTGSTKKKSTPISYTSAMTPGGLHVKVGKF